MPLDPTLVQTQGSPEWWMDQLSRRMLAPERMQRLATLQAYADNRPPIIVAAESQRKAFYAFCRMSRLGLARAVVRSRMDRIALRAIRTAAADDDAGDAVAWAVARSSGFLDQYRQALSDMLSLSEGYMRGAVTPDGRPVAVACDPRFTITAVDPLDPTRTLAAMHLVWDEWAGMDYAYLWLPGEQWVAERSRSRKPSVFTPVNVSPSRERTSLPPYWKLSFSPSGFQMRPMVSDVPEDERDGRPYSERYGDDLLPVQTFLNRDGKAEFEEALDSIDRVNQTIMQRLVTMAVQAYKQRALKQDASGTGPATDRLPDKNPDTQEPINWDEVFQPGPDALWKLPPGVTIWESTEVQVAPMLSAETASIRQVATETNTPLPLLSDDINQSAEGAQLRREGLVFTVEDRRGIVERSGSNVLAFLLAMSPDEARYAVGDDGERVDRADAAKIAFDWLPAERYSLAERAAADSANKSLSADMAAERIWGLTPDEVAVNKRQRASDGLLAQAKAAGVGSAAG